jgi:hypothetical protein
MPTARATDAHLFTWTADTVYSMAALGVVAAAAGIHPDVTLRIEVTVGPSKNMPPRHLPAVRASKAGNATIELADAERLSWRFVWRTLSRAVDVNRAVGNASAVHVVLRLHGNPAAEVRQELETTPAWTAATAAAPNGDLIPRPTNSFFMWALSAAAVCDAASTLAAAAMYPAPPEKVAEIRERVRGGFPRPKGAAAAEAAAAEVYVGRGGAEAGGGRLPQLTDTLI